MNDFVWSRLQEEGMAELLGSLLNPQPIMPDWYVGLFINDPPESSALTLADLDEPTDSGYSRKIVHRPDWVVGTPAAGCVHATMPGHDIVWQAVDGGETVNGAFFVRPADSKLIAVFRLADDKIVSWTAGATLTLTPDFPLTSATC